jgi:hypothetical protein
MRTTNPRLGSISGLLYRGRGFERQGLFERETEEAQAGDLFGTIVCFGNSNAFEYV